MPFSSAGVEERTTIFPFTALDCGFNGVSGCSIGQHDEPVAKVLIKELVRRLRPAHDIQRHRLMRVAAKAFDLKIEVTGIQGIAEVVLGGDVGRSRVLDE